MPRVILNDRMLIGLKADKQTFFWDRSLPSFGVRANPGGKRTFVLLTGKPRKQFTLGHYPTMTLAMARKEAHKLLEDTNPTTITFEAARDLFFTRHIDNLKPTTAHEQKNLLRRFPFQKPLGLITLKDVERVLNDMPRGSARSCFNVIRTFFNWCVANDYLEKSPLKKSPYRAQQRDRLLSDAEVRQIWCESFQHGTWGQIVRCLILSGQRLNQFCSFDHSWIKRNTIEFPPAVMKHNGYHVLPLTDNLRQHLPSLPKPYTSVSDAMRIMRVDRRGIVDRLGLGSALKN